MTRAKRSPERGEQSLALMREGGSDTARWSQSRNLVGWSGRAAKAAKMIESGSVVVDLGAGAMTLGELLPRDCRYVPVDIVSRGPGCLVADFNAGQFPDINSDYAVALGVLEYLHLPERLLAAARQRCSQLIVSYTLCQRRSSIGYRRGMGWVNDYDLADFTWLLTEAGWHVEAHQTLKLRWRTREILLSAS